VPTYEYLCNECEYGFEAVQSFTEAAIEKCPKCHGVVRKVYNNVGVVFKGSGFYKTDSKSTPTGTSEKPAPTTESKPAPTMDSTTPAKSTE
jgi:putative FmdB family regulatory protein